MNDLVYEIFGSARFSACMKSEDDTHYEYVKISSWADLCNYFKKIPVDNLIQLSFGLNNYNQDCYFDLVDNNVYYKVMVSKNLESTRYACDDFALKIKEEYLKYNVIIIDYYIDEYNNYWVFYNPKNLSAIKIENEQLKVYDINENLINEMKLEYVKLHFVPNSFFTEDESFKDMEKLSGYEQTDWLRFYRKFKDGN